MGPKPGPTYSLDRINPNGNYEPSNCRWATRAEQYANKRPYSEWKPARPRKRYTIKYHTGEWKAPDYLDFRGFTMRPRPAAPIGAESASIHASLDQGGGYGRSDVPPEAASHLKHDCPSY